MAAWNCVLELDAERRIVTGDRCDLAATVGRGADLRIATEFHHNEHIDVTSPNSELVREVAEFAVTYRIAGTWVAGIMSLRQPIELPDGFGPRPSMSFFLYNQDGTQAIARPFLDGMPTTHELGPSNVAPPRGMPKYQVVDAWDSGSNAPSQNFIYEFGRYRYFVNDSWQEVYHHSASGAPISGSLDVLAEAFAGGKAIKIGLDNFCSSRGPSDDPGLAHELFVQGGSAYYYTQQRLLIVGTHPLVRVQPRIPLRYATGNWDFGWLMARTDGRVVYRRCDPYDLRFTDQISHHAIRWFVR